VLHGALLEDILSHLLGGGDGGTAVLPIQGDGARPVGAVIVFDAVVAAAFVAVDVGVVEEVGDLVAGGVGDRVGLGIQGQGGLPGHGSIAGAYHAGGIGALGGQDVVDGLVRVGGHGQVVVAG